MKKKMKLYQKKIRDFKIFKFKDFEINVSAYDESIPLEDLIKLFSVIRISLNELDYHYFTSISLSFVRESEMKKINKEFRGVDSVTDVLSFPIDEFGGILGDIVICKKRCIKQSKTYGNTPLREMAYLVCHSILHLFNYDHMNKRDKKIMRTMEKKIMKRVDFLL